MIRILAISVCAVALSMSAAGAKEKHHASTKHHVTPSTTGMGGGATQNKYGGNPNAGGGPSGASEATINPGSSKPAEMR